MPRPSPLSSYPAATLHAVRSAVAALLKYQDILPTDLSIKLDIFHGDINDSLRPVRDPVPIFIPHPATPPSPPPGQGTAIRQQGPRHPSAPRHTLPPERHPR